MFKQHKNFRPLIFGIDLSTKSTGWAYLTVAEPIKLYASGKIVSDGDSFLERWEDALAGIKKVTKQYGFPAYCAIEQPNSPNNMETTRQLCGLFGIIGNYFYQNGVWCVDVNTAHAKKVFCGKGGGGKEPTVLAANEKFGLSFTMADNDIADAIQVAYALRSDLMDSEGSDLKKIALLPL